MTKGFIYILVNDSMPGIVKVGKTKNNPIDRAGQLSAASGVPEKFSVFRHYCVSDYDEAEKFSHKILERIFGRPNERREFFSGACQDVAAILDEALQPYINRTDSFSLNNEFASAFLRLERKEFSMAKLEFENLFESLSITEYKIAESNFLKRVSGAYLASCFAVSKIPNFKYIISSNIKSDVLDFAIEFAKEFESDPAINLIKFSNQI